MSEILKPSSDICEVKRANTFQPDFPSSVRWHVQSRATLPPHFCQPTARLDQWDDHLRTCEAKLDKNFVCYDLSLLELIVHWDMTFYQKDLYLYGENEDGPSYSDNPPVLLLLLSVTVNLNLIVPAGNVRLKSVLHQIGGGGWYPNLSLLFLCVSLLLSINLSIPYTYMYLSLRIRIPSPYHWIIQPARDALLLQTHCVAPIIWCVALIIWCVGPILRCFIVWFWLAHTDSASQPTS